MTRIVKAFPLGTEAADLERSVVAAHHAGKHSGIIARNCGLCTHEQAVASLRGKLAASANPAQVADRAQRVAKRHRAVIARAIEIEKLGPPKVHLQELTAYEQDGNTTTRHPADTLETTAKGKSLVLRRPKYQVTAYPSRVRDGKGFDGYAGVSPNVRVSSKNARRIDDAYRQRSRSVTLSGNGQDLRMKHRVAKAFDSERSRHGRAALGTGALAGGSVAAAYGARQVAQSAKPRRISQGAAARNSAAAHLATAENFAHIANDKTLPASTRKFAASAGKTHMRALQHAAVAAEEGKQVARRVRGSRGLAAGAAGLAAAAYGLHHHDIRGSGRSYGYR